MAVRSELPGDELSVKNRLTTLTLLTLLALALPTHRAAGQIVRGLVTERASRSPLPGVLVWLERANAGAAPQSVNSVLTNERGEYAVRATAEGRYRVSAKRIGVQRFTSPEFDLAAGETKRVDIPLDAVLYTLPEVVVSAETFCMTRANQAQRVASLWEEARTALTATQISLRDRLFRGRVNRYVRELDPKNLRVLSESRADMQGLLDKPFASVSGDSLSRGGYWRELPDGSSVYNAPDADALLSDAFLRDHCFAAVDGGRDRRGLVGIAFEPQRNRVTADIRGTLWLDARTFELRFLEFKYTRLLTADSARVGGELHFARLSSGAWVVRRWFIRMPQFAHYQDTPMSVAGLTRPAVIVRPGIYRLIEEGGDVFSERLRLFEKPASVTGVVLDSTGLPFAGATVRLAGTPFAAVAGTDGRFLIDSLPAGNHTLVVEQDGYSTLGMPAADSALILTEGETQRVTLRAAASAEVVARLCDGKLLPARRAVLRLTMLDTATATPLAGLAVRVHWNSSRGTAAMDAYSQSDGLKSATDARGVVTFCDVPGDLPLEVAILRQSGEPAPVTTLEKLGFNQVVARTLKAQHPR
jgi:Carboxypeptidase regulatory-like domain